VKIRVQPVSERTVGAHKNILTKANLEEVQPCQGLMRIKAPNIRLPKDMLGHVKMSLSRLAANLMLLHPVTVTVVLICRLTKK
jgi:hypothetical protein